MVFNISMLSKKSQRYIYTLIENISGSDYLCYMDCERAIKKISKCWFFKYLIIDKHSVSVYILKNAPLEYRKDMIDVLIENNYNMNKGGALKITPLLYLCGNLTSKTMYNIINKLLFVVKVNIKVKDIDGNGLLHILSSQNNNIIVYENEITRYLVSDLDILMPNKKGESPIYMAIVNKKTNLINIFVEELIRTNKINCCIHKKTRDTILTALSRFKNKEVLLNILNRMIADDDGLSNIDLDKQNYCGVSAVMYASQMFNRVEMSKFVSLGANLDLQDAKGKTILMFASGTGNIDLVNLVLGTKININKTDVDGNTALLYAAINKKYNIIQLLINSGANPNIINKKKKKYLDFIPNYGWENDIKIYTSKECIICNDEFEEHELVMVKPCNHKMYCESCIKQITNGKCPYCRGDIATIVKTINLNI